MDAPEFIDDTLPPSPDEVLVFLAKGKEPGDIIVDIVVRMDDGSPDKKASRVVPAAEIWDAARPNLKAQLKLDL